MNDAPWPLFLVVTVLCLVALAFGVERCEYCYSDRGRTDVRCAGFFTQ